MPRVQASSLARLIFIEEDPGVPSGLAANPLAGLDFRAASDVCRILSENRTKAKAIKVWWSYESGKHAVTVPGKETKFFDGVRAARRWAISQQKKHADQPRGFRLIDVTKRKHKKYKAGKWVGLKESKAIGTASLKAGVGERDLALRNVQRDTLRDSIKRAGRNTGRDLSELYEQTRIDLRAIVRDYLAGKATIEETRLESAEAFRAAHERAREIGRRASGLVEVGGNAALLREEEKWFRSAVREELLYWNEFLNKLGEGKLSDTKVAERIDGYVRALRFMYESARIQAMPDNVLLYWMGPPKEDPHICKGCAYMMEHSPFPKDVIPAVPRDGSTQCFSRCRHRIVVRVTESADDVIARKRALPSRRVMVEALRRIKRHKRPRKSAARGRARNPFKGEGLPKRRRRR